MRPALGPQWTVALRAASYVVKSLVDLGGGVESAGPRAASGYLRDCMNLDLNSVWHWDGGFLAFLSKLIELSIES